MAFGCYAPEPNVGEPGDERAWILAEAIRVGEVRHKVNEKDDRQRDECISAPVENVE